MSTPDVSAPPSGADLQLPRAALWDMDGTLVDTEPYWIASEFELVERYGREWSDEYAHLLVGNALEVSAGIIIEKSGIPLTVPEVIDELLAMVVRKVSDHVPWRPGARELLADFTTRGIPTALVTMSWTVLADVVVSQMPPDSFTLIVTGDVVDHGKPHPEPYLKACNELGVQPNECVAFEDSPAGVASATAAGVPTIAVPHVVPVPHTAGSVQIPSLEGLDVLAVAQLVAGADG